MNVPSGTIEQGARLDAALVVASDVHLRRVDDSRSELLLDVMARLAPTVEYLVLNGDIFDFCFGDSDYFRRKYARYDEAFSNVAKAGTRILFLEGNHEVHLDKIGWRDVDVIQQRDYVLTMKDGRRIKITHGDLLTGEPLYRAFRGVVKSQFARRCATHVPGSWLDAYAMRHATVSRAQDKYRQLDHGRILSAFNRWLADGTYDDGIIGHFHIPYAEKRETHDGLMLSVESWDRPNLLVYGSGKFQRVFLRGPGDAFVKEPVESIFK